MDKLPTQTRPARRARTKARRTCTEQSPGRCPAELSAPRGPNPPHPRTRHRGPSSQSLRALGDRHGGGRGHTAATGCQGRGAQGQSWTARRTPGGAPRPALCGGDSRGRAPHTRLSVLSRTCLTGAGGRHPHSWGLCCVWTVPCPWAGRASQGLGAGVLGSPILAQRMTFESGQ